MATSKLQETKALGDVAKKAIQKHIDAMTQAFNSGDLDALMDEISEDAVWMVPDLPLLIGKKAIRAFYEPIINSNTTFSGGILPDNQELLISGDLAVYRAVLEGTITPADGTNPIKISNKFLNVIRKEADGSWKHLWDIMNPIPQS